jgi:protoporphyrinogen oxidase
MANTNKDINIAVIGSGVGGLAFAYYAMKKNKHIHIDMYEKEAQVGGLAVPFEIQGKRLEKFYHHIFQTDSDIITLIKDLGLEKKLKWYKDNRATLYKNKMYAFTSPIDLLRFTPIPFVDRIRTGIVLLYLSRLKNWKSLEDKTADEWMPQRMGKVGYDVLWKNLLYGKFQNRYKDITMSWLWSRIETRSNSKGVLGYMKDSFGEVFDTLEQKIVKQGGTIYTKTMIKEILQKGDKVLVTYADEAGLEQQKEYDRVIITTPSQVYTKFLKGLDEKYNQNVNDIDYISAQTIILTLSHKLTNYYWVSVADTSAPALVVVEQSNLIDQYNGKHIVYIGNYLQNDSEVLRMSDDELKKRYYPFLKKLNKNFKEKWVEEFRVFRAPFAQPIVTTSYHTHIPAFASGVKNVYILNMSQVYPEDRGMNFAIKNAHILLDQMTDL